MVCTADPNQAGRVIAGGDIWGIYMSTDTGSSYQPCMLGLPIKANGTTNGISIRAAVWSIKNPGRCYFGSGALKNAIGAGYFGYVSGINLVQSTGPGFGTNCAAPAANLRPRAGGSLIQIDYPGSGNEYLYLLATSHAPAATLTRSTDGGTSFVDLFATTIRTDMAWKTSALFTSSGGTFPDTLLLASYRDTTLDATTPGGSTVWQVTSGAANIRNATSSADLTITQLTGTFSVPPVVEDLCVINNNIYAACGPYGVYQVTGGGTTWTQISGTFFNNNWVSALDGNSNVMVVGCSGTGVIPSPGANMVAKSTNGGTSWTWITQSAYTHDTSGQISSVPWGTTDEFWLMKAASPAFTNYLGGASMDIQDVSVDKTDPSGNRIYVCGSAGAWLTKDGGAHWRPSVVGTNGGFDKGVIITPNGGVISDNTDYKQFVSTNYGASGYRNSTPITTTADLGDKTDGSGNVYHLINTTGAPDILRNGISIADNYYKASIQALKDFQVSPEGFVYISQAGGGLLVGNPNLPVITHTRILKTPTHKLIPVF